MNFSDESKKNFSASSILKKYLIFLPPIFCLIVSYKLVNAKFIILDDPLIFSLFQNFSFINIFLISGDTYWYRPVVDILFYLESLLWGRDPFGYHLTSLLLHLINTMLVFALSCQLFHDRNEKHLIAFTSSSFFAVHPIHLETIAWISARADLLSSSLFISAFIFFLIMKRAETQHKKLLYCLLSIFFYLLGLFSKETVIVFIPCLISYFFLVIFKKKRVLSEKIKKMSLEKFKPLIPITSIIAATISFILFKKLAIKGADAGSAIFSLYLRHTILPYFKDPDFGTALFHSLLPFFDFLGAWGFYVKKFFFPSPINLAIFSISEDFYAISGLFFLAIPGYLIFKHKGIISFLIFSGLLTLAPAFPIAYSSLSWTHFSERYLYLPSVFFCIAFGFWFTRLHCKVTQKKLLVGFFIVLLTMLALSLKQKTTIWQNSISICEHIISRNPKNSAGYQSLGIYYLGENNYEQAKKYLAKSIELGGAGPSYFFMGKLAFKNGDREKALDLIKKSTGVRTGQWNYYATIGDIYMEKAWEKPSSSQDIKKAIAYYKKAIILRKNIPSVKYRLTKAYFESEDHKMALVSAKELLEEHGDTIWGENVTRYTTKRAY